MTAADFCFAVDCLFRCQIYNATLELKLKTYKSLGLIRQAKIAQNTMLAVIADDFK